MTIVFWLVGGVVVFVIAAVAVGRVTTNLAKSPERAVFDADESLEFVAEALPGDVTAQLSYDDVRTILRLFHDYLHAQGVATTAGDDDVDELAVADPERAVDYIVERAALADIIVDPDHARAVVAAQLSYFEAIGVVGQAVDGPDDPIADQ